MDGKLNDLKFKIDIVQLYKLFHKIFIPFYKSTLAMSARIISIHFFVTEDNWHAICQLSSVVGGVLVIVIRYLFILFSKSIIHLLGVLYLHEVCPPPPLSSPLPSPLPITPNKFPNLFFLVDSRTEVRVIAWELTVSPDGGVTSLL